RVECDRSVEEILPSVFDQREPPVVVHPPVSDVEQAARRAKCGEVNCRWMLLGIQLDHFLQCTSQIAAEPRRRPESIFGEVARIECAELQGDERKQTDGDELVK